MSDAGFGSRPHAGAAKKMAGAALLLYACLFLTGCGRPPAQSGPPPSVPEVMVSLPITKEVIDYEDFPGRLEAVSSVDVRARATGRLDRVHFKEGEIVKEGDLLFEIDPRLYQAQLNSADANVVQSQARLKRLDSDFTRAASLLPKRGISQEDYDKVAGDRAEAGAAIGVVQANRELAALNLSYTKVTAEIGGRISRRFVDPGNIVKADDTILTNIVSLDPIYAYFDLDERSTIRARRLVREGKIKWSPEGGLHVLMGLADEEGFPRRGLINFADNRIDAETGTWRLRARFDNPDLELSPGFYVRMRLPIGEPFKALLISEQALGTNQGQKFVYVVDDANKVTDRRVTVGRLHDGLRVITDGLKPGEKVVVSGLQRVRPGIQVNPKLVDMPMTRDATEKHR
jgi:RND family efflux transporter MFP subunit